ncbi:MAG TPA: exodeoxyribonuclease III [Dongiaceae bacterium]|nr:exodeoxyribonuclease III [Dongiaceae bacterium]
MRIVSWNINSVRQRLDPLARLAAQWKPDVICLQEVKARPEDFPFEAIRALGYGEIHLRSMKGYNGVAILSRLPLDKADGRDWCGKEDCRHALAHLPGGVELHNFYIPAGGDLPDPEVNEKFAHKLAFLDEAASWFAEGRRDGRRMILLGDLNIAPLETDVWSHKALLKVVSHTPVEVEKLGRLQAAAQWVDAVRQVIPPSERLYSWWSYRAADWSASDRGRRLDHVWVTPSLAPAVAGARILREARGWTAASDHVPVIVDLE